ncbi:MAG: primosomal protein N' [Gammaproteobacteria bacterium]
MGDILKVALDLPLRTLFDYRASQPVAIGCRVEVPFGRGKKIGVVTAVEQHSDLPAEKLKSPLGVIDEQPIVPAELATLLDWSSRYYHHPVGEVWFSALPTRLRQGQPALPQPEERWRLTQQGKEHPPAQRASKQLAVWNQLKSGPKTADLLDQQLTGWRPAVRQLIDKSLAELEHHFDSWSGNGNDPGLTANTEQQQAIDSVSGSLGKFQVFLLDGVTGSGKTEVYLQLVKKVLDSDKQALVLVPEIGLTTQTVSRFRDRFAVPIVLLHSGLTDLQRHNGWLLAASGEARIVIGTRSALFTPLANPGLIIIDEEHDDSYKQQEGFRYSARDLAAVRAKNIGIPLVLGSATPVLESLHSAISGRYQHLKLPQRAGNRTMPAVEVVDARQQRTRGLISASLRAEIRQHLQLGQQVLLFLNRRGYAPVLLCDSCGAIPECSRCETPFTFHQQRNLLVCHHCGSERRPPDHCESCQAEELVCIGAGTERVEEELREQFPDYPLLRIDRDTTRQKGSLDQHLQQIHTGDTRILLGTQMLAKGHHFPAVTLVGILDCDQALFATDFRAAEKLAQLIYQVAGRCGRGDQPGRVLIQTHQPHHPLWQQLLSKTYTELASSLLAARQLNSFPPFQHLALLRAEASGQQTAIDCLHNLVGRLPADNQLETWGPVPAPRPKRAGHYRAQLLFQAAHRAPLHRQLEHAIALLDTRANRRIRWSIDVDPIDLY